MTILAGLKKLKELKKVETGVIVITLEGKTSCLSCPPAIGLIGS